MREALRQLWRGSVQALAQLGCSCCPHASAVCAQWEREAEELPQLDLTPQERDLWRQLTHRLDEP